MPVKITLEDGREFHVGQEVEWSIAYPSRAWVIRKVGVSISLQQIYANQNCIRYISPKVKRPMTAKEVWSLLQTGVEWKSDKWIGKSYAIGSSVIMHENKILLTNQGYAYEIESCTYRTAPDQPWQKFEVEE